MILWAGAKGPREIFAMVFCLRALRICGEIVKGETTYADHCRVPTLDIGEWVYGGKWVPLVFDTCVVFLIKNQQRNCSDSAIVMSSLRRPRCGSMVSREMRVPLPQGFPGPVRSRVSRGSWRPDNSQLSFAPVPLCKPPSNGTRSVFAPIGVVPAAL